MRRKTIATDSLPQKQPSHAFMLSTLAISSVIFAVVALLYPRYWQASDSKQSGVEYELRPLLSPDAQIILPGSPKFLNYTSRWSQFDTPNVNVVVSVATEQDVLYANAHDLPLLAYSGGHGSISSLANLKNGIEISLKQMTQITIAPDGNSATIGGGASVRDVSKALAAVGKRTVTGICECVGAVAPMLGGGHGLLQGQYGLAADQLLSARVVLGNGTVVTTSNTSHSEMFWAVRGAGHNFGVVTEYTSRIYDARPDEMWELEQFIFAGYELEHLYEVVSQMKKSQPANVVEWDLFVRVPLMDPVNPVLVYSIISDRSISEPNNYSAPIHSLKPLHVVSRTVPYLDIAGLTGNGASDIACQKGATVLRFPIYLEAYNVTAMRQVYDAFRQMMIDQPAFNNSLFLIEGYSTQGVQRVPAESTAFPHRGEKLLLSPAIIYLPDPKLDAIAMRYGKHLREILREGSGKAEIAAYVNYAHGNEGLESIYGFEPWRLAKLRSLKKMYDPGQRFSFYAPIE